MVSSHGHFVWIIALERHYSTSLQPKKFEKNVVRQYVYIETKEGNGKIVKFYLYTKSPPRLKMTVSGV